MDNRRTVAPDKTIIACCTPQGAGAIALLRLAGPAAIAIADAMAFLPGNKRLAMQTSHTISFGSVITAEGKEIDQVLWLLMREPKTFTGFDTVEITCHNNPLIIQQIIELALVAGAQPAGPGEFTQQAVVNGKIDLLQAEAIHDLIKAQSHQAAKQYLAQLGGTLSSWMHELTEELLLILAWCNASFEFIEEEGAEFGIQIRQRLQLLQQKIATLLAQQPAKRHLQEGFRIALVGTVNAGKSSLFNTLLQQPRAIVTNIAGTTRDSIEAQLYTAEHRITLVDTAGLRTTDDIIEQQGIERSFHEAATADLLLLVIDSGAVITPAQEEIYRRLIKEFGHKALVVYNKSDIGCHTMPCIAWPTTALTVSSVTHDGIAELKKLITEKLTALADACTAPYLINERQYQALTIVQREIAQLLTMTEAGFEYELVAIHLQEIIAELEQLTGKTVSEQAMDKIFKEFCVGK
ncbi:tRNA uridine-5-carboxymethylaminomethyl(34) synthesis GTPase MnmE [Candidatus Dependentiae bacterium]|nr:tRNA uridine-5-carboxymethylaminomethyl(34) synthesis GTPase MnmE [Candidatus Dependentiae bacterium]